jgi:hypothetical protein
MDHDMRFVKNDGKAFLMNLIPQPDEFEEHFFDAGRRARCPRWRLFVE